MYTYTVNDANTIEVFVNGQEVPVLVQPHYPNGDPFDTVGEAEEWAQLYVSYMTDENAPFVPIGKGIPGEPRLTKTQILEGLKRAAENFGDNVPRQISDRIAVLEAQLSGQ